MSTRSLLSLATENIYDPTNLFELFSVTAVVQPTFEGSDLKIICFEHNLQNSCSNKSEHT